MKRNLREALTLGTVWLFLGLLVVGCDNPTSGSTEEDTDGTTAGTLTYEVGETGPAGGWIFFVDEEDQYPDWTYLEAAPANWAGGTAGDISRSWRTTTLSGSFETGFAVGTGQENTIAILGLGGSSAAAQAAATYEVTVGEVIYDDWFLPSQNELITMYQNLHRQGLGAFSDTPNGAGSNIYYWSSYARNGSPWAVNFDLAQGENAAPTGSSRDNSYYVRPIRRF